MFSLLHFTVIGKEKNGESHQNVTSALLAYLHDYHTALLHIFCGVLETQTLIYSVHLPMQPRNPSTMLFFF